MAERLFRAIGRPDLVDDPRFRTNADRLRLHQLLATPLLAGQLLSDPAVFASAHTWLLGLGVGVLSTALPYALDQVVLTRIGRLPQVEQAGAAFFPVASIVTPSRRQLGIDGELPHSFSAN